MTEKEQADCCVWCVYCRQNWSPTFVQPQQYKTDCTLKTESLDKKCCSNFEDRNKSIYKISITVDHLIMAYGRKTAIYGYFQK